ncbi:MAG TPA: hypothetical protein V6D17_10725 [Candidatus Obscuribacterales bacterium]
MTAKGMRFGELLLEFGLLSEESLDEAIKQAAQLGVPLGRALIISNKLTEHDVNLTVALQSIMKIWDLPLQNAKNAMEIARREKLSITEALARSGWKKVGELPGAVGSLGSLLLDSTLINDEQFAEAQRSSYETGLPLGRVLILKGVISHSVLAKVLELQRLIRDGNITYQNAARELQSMQSGKASVSTSLAQRQKTIVPTRKTVRLGEFLMLAGILTESDLMNALELGLEKQLTVGEAMIELGLLSKALLSSTLAIQSKVSAGELDLANAVQELRKAAGLTEHPPETSGAGDLPSSIVIGELLRLCGLVDENQITRAIELSTKFPALIGKMLVVAGAIDEATLLAALRCQFLIRQQAITIEQGIAGLTRASKMEICLDDALDELGIPVPSRMRRDVMAE